MRPLLRLGNVLCISIIVACTTSQNLRAAEANPAPPRITADKTTNGLPRLVFPYPAAQSYQVFSSDNVTNAFTPDTTSGKFFRTYMDRHEWGTGALLQGQRHGHGQ